MTQYAKVIDNRRCIGCHACSVACKEENQVPLGVFRTWVKYTEKGVFPNTRRNFQVTRCNQCDNPPCVTICPVSAMYRRADGIVEFDSELCIGCKACLNACPYDAIYIDPESHTAAKCHFCAHRVDRGLEPACVVVCPERAIIVGDMEDPNSEISRLLAREETSVRKPEQNTRPKLFYIEGDAATLTPGAAPARASYLFADMGRDSSGPVQNAGRFALNLVQTVYDVPHERAWGWKVSTYLWTKSIGAGTLFVLAGVLELGRAGDPGPLFDASGALFSLVLIGITTGLLVWDLKRPERFLKIVFHPQWRSWVTLGAYVLIGFSLFGTAWLATTALAMPMWAPNLAGLATAGLRRWLDLPVIVLGVLSAIYSAFLFGQAEGRDLWQSPLTPVELFLHAAIGGSGALVLLSFIVPGGEVVGAAGGILAGSLLALLAIKLVSDFLVPPPTTNARMGHHAMTVGEYRGFYWGGMAALMTALALALAGWQAGASILPGIAALVSFPALWLLEHGWVLAGQSPPNS